MRVSLAYVSLLFLYLYSTNMCVKFLKRLDGWTQKLTEISTSLRIYNEKKVAPLVPLQPTTMGNNEILHKDICLLANHWKHESAKNWLKVLCVLDGVAFHIRLLRYVSTPYIAFLIILTSVAA